VALPEPDVIADSGGKSFERQLEGKSACERWPKRSSDRRPWLCDLLGDEHFPSHRRCRGLAGSPFKGRVKR
jgi:hypothetical protein